MYTYAIEMERELAEVREEFRVLEFNLQVAQVTILYLGFCS